MSEESISAAIKYADKIGEKWHGKPIRYRNLPISYEKTDRNEIIVRYDNGDPVDRFDIFFSLPCGWIAWCVDTMRMDLKVLRREIVKDLNSKKPSGAGLKGMV